MVHAGNKSTETDIKIVKKKISELFQERNFGELNDYLERTLQSSPHSRDLLLLSGNVSIKLGNLLVALKRFESAHKLDPTYIQTYLLKGTVEIELGTKDQGIASLKKALKIELPVAKTQKNSAKAYLQLGILLKTYGELKSAALCFERSAIIDPNSDKAHSFLGLIQHSMGDLKDAVINLRRAASKNPQSAQIHNNLGVSLRECGDLEEAKNEFIKATALDPHLSEARLNLGDIFFESEDYSKCKELFYGQDSLSERLYLLKSYFHLSMESEFFMLLNELNQENVVSSLLGSLILRSEIKFKRKISNSFCNFPLECIWHRNLSLEVDFNDIFLEPCRQILTDSKTAYREQAKLKAGTQTAGNIFDNEDPRIEKIRYTILQELEEYYRFLRGKDEGLVHFWPKELLLKGWLVSYQSGGAISPHMHEASWITGSVYINVPKKKRPESGNLVLCVDAESQHDKSSSPKTSLDVVTGSICLFPASLLHYTIPFESSEDRIVLAFDLIPKDSQIA